jgi:hypothetical protein
MSNNTNISQEQAAAAATAEIQPITPEELIETVRALRLRIPDFGQMSVVDARAVRTSASLYAPFKEAAIAAVGASEPVTAAVGLSAEELHKLNDEAGRWSAAEDELKALTQGVAAANLRRRHRVGLAALQAYSITRQLVRHADHSDLLPHLDAMKQTSRFGKKRRATTPTTPEPTPVVL